MRSSCIYNDKFPALCPVLYPLKNNTFKTTQNVLCSSEKEARAKIGVKFYKEYNNKTANMSQVLAKVLLCEL